MNKLEFKEIVDGLKSVYGDKVPEMTGLARELWYECLSDMDFELTKKAIVNHLKASKYPPTVADIREQYELIISKKRSHIMKLEQLFSEISTYYPKGRDDGQAKSIFFSKLYGKDENQQYKYALSIKNAVIDYVKKIEHDCGELGMTLSECINFAGECIDVKSKSSVN